MPTAQDYELLARRFGELAEEVRNLLPDVQNACDSSVFAGGLFTASVHRAFDRDQDLVRAITDELDEQRSICVSRAGLIRDYEVARTKYRSALHVYHTERARWLGVESAFAEDPAGAERPGPAPLRPAPPPEPPTWAVLSA